MMESFLSRIGHNKSRVVEVATNRESCRNQGFLATEYVSGKARYGGPFAV
jgi:hypothetical protein